VRAARSKGSRGILFGGVEGVGGRCGSGCHSGRCIIIIGIGGGKSQAISAMFSQIWH